MIQFKCGKKIVFRKGMKGEERPRPSLRRCARGPVGEETKTRGLWRDQVGFGGVPKGYGWAPGGYYWASEDYGWSQSCVRASGAYMALYGGLKGLWLAARRL